MEQDKNRTEDFGNTGPFVSEVMNGAQRKSWCAGWLTKRCNEEQPGVIPYTWSTYQLVEATKKQKATRPLGMYSPKPGDFFYVLGGPYEPKPSHAGIIICIEPNGGPIHVLSGNKSNPMSTPANQLPDGVYETLYYPEDLKALEGLKYKGGIHDIGFIDIGASLAYFKEHGPVAVDSGHTGKVKNNPKPRGRH